MNFWEDPTSHVHEVFYGKRGFKPSIELLLAEGFFGQAVAVTYSAIDVIAALARPTATREVKRTDFIAWCDRYLEVKGAEVLTGIDFYAARCAVLHTYGAESALSRAGKARMIVYRGGRVAEPLVEVPPSHADRIVMVGVEELAGAFLVGLLQCLLELHQSPERLSRLEERLASTFQFSVRPW